MTRPARSSSSRAILRLAMALACGASFLSSCNQPKRGGRDQQEVVPPKRNVTWLAANDDRDAAAWLASLIYKRDLPADDVRAREIRRLLDVADRRFLESDRMVANRIAQLTEMLAESGSGEDPLALLEALISIAPESSIGKETYGDLCQFYLNLRRTGVTRDAALKNLKDRYKALHREL